MLIVGLYHGHVSLLAISLYRQNNTVLVENIPYQLNVELQSMYVDACDYFMKCTTCLCLY